MTETKDNLRVLVCGGRHYGNVNAIYNALDEIKPTVVISGCASGADSIAIMWAEHHGPSNGQANHIFLQQTELDRTRGVPCSGGGGG